MAKAKQTAAQELLAAVKSDIAARQPGFAPWYRRVTPEQKEVVDTLHAAFHSGDLGVGVCSAAKSISKHLATIGITIGRNGVESWLRKTPEEL